MSFLSKLLGGGAVEPIKAVGNIADELFTSDDERLTHEEVMRRIEQRPHLVQAEINKVAATHRSRFVAGARPSILWGCSAGVWFAFVINPIITWFTGEPGPELPMDNLMELTLGMLGLAALRTYEKSKGISK